MSIRRLSVVKKGSLESVFLVVLVIYLSLDHHGSGVMGMTIERRSAGPERSADEYPDYQLGAKYDEYPMIVPKKRTAMLVDRLMVALQQAIEEEEAANRIDDGLAITESLMSPDEVRKMDLQRRGHSISGGQQKGRIYWRCYFNAVTCFKK